MTRRVVMVRWVDSSEAHGGWRSLDDLLDFKCPMECVTVGFEVARKDGVLVVAPHMTVEDDPDACGVMWIPEVAIVDLTTLVEAVA